MNIKQNNSYGVESYNIESVNLNEMRQMAELKSHIKNILDSHKKDSEKKEYISDDNLKLMYAILSVFTQDYSNDAKSAFDEFLKKQEEKKEKPTEQPKQEKKPIRLPDDDLYGGE